MGIEVGVLSIFIKNMTILKKVACCISLNLCALTL